MKLSLASSSSGTMGIGRRPPLTKIVRASGKNGGFSTEIGPLRPSRSSKIQRLVRHNRSRTVNLVYRADRSTAAPGDVIIFTAWVTNESRSHLRNIRLIPRSFTNEAMQTLSYTSHPEQSGLWLESLAPGESIMRSFSYRVEAADHAHGGNLVSAMQVRACCLGKHVSDEQDAIVSLSGTQMVWPARNQRRSLGYWSSSHGGSLKPRRRQRPAGQARNQMPYSLSGSPTGFSAGQSTSCS